MQKEPRLHLRMCGSPFAPKGACRYVVYTWALKGLLDHDFGAHVGTVMVLGLFGWAFWILTLRFQSTIM